MVFLKIFPKNYPPYRISSNKGDFLQRFFVSAFHAVDSGGKDLVPIFCGIFCNGLNIPVKPFQNRIKSML